MWRQNKNAREIVSKNFAINIDELFTLLFTNSKFFYDFQAERKTFDIVQCPWKQSDKSEDKFREVSYTLNLNHSIGPKTSRATTVDGLQGLLEPGKELDLTPPGRAGGDVGIWFLPDGNSKH